MNSVNLKASVSFVGDGSTKKFYFGFDYINKQFVKVQVGAESSPLTYLTDYTVDDRSVTLTDTPAVGVAIRVYRETPSDRIVEWTDGAFIKASQMTLESLQQLHLIEEAQDYSILNSLSKYPDGVNFNALGSRVINVSDPKDPQDAVTKHYMESVQDGFVARNTSLLEQTTTQATNAKNSASSSATSASQSASSASASETSNQSSKKWAESTSSPDLETDTDSTTGLTQSSRSWALYSKTKAQEANTSATNAKTSETKAKTSETNAKNSETRASASASASASSASASATSASNAKTSETNAKNSARQAAESAGVFQDFQGATASTDGIGGKVPKPLAGQQDKVLKADGTWGDGVTPNTLWNGMHHYPVNYVPSDASNKRWNSLGFCSIYYTPEAEIDNKPTDFGQLINIPVDLGDESAQLWIEQYSGAIYSRGGNWEQPLNSVPFKMCEQVDSKGKWDNWIRYTSGLQICWTFSVGANSRWNFPVAFSSKPIVQSTDIDDNWSWVSDITTTGCTHKSGGQGNVVAIGWWK